MNAEILFKEIGLINDKFIIEADTTNLRKKSAKHKNLQLFNKTTTKKTKTGNMKLKRLISIIASIILIALLSLSVVALVQYIIKEKNVFQKAAEEGIDVSKLEEYADFAFTPFEEDTKRNNEKIYANDKEKIYDMMLNSIDYYNTLDITFTTSMLAGENVLVHCQTDIDKSISYQVIYNGGKLLDEILSDGSFLTQINHEAKTINPFYLDTKTRENAFPIDLSERIDIMPDGLPCFNYRVNATNCTMASFCIFPQEIAFSYLKNFDLWEITENDEYLERKCIVINGISTEYTATKHDVNKFTMYIDNETGILMKFIGIQNGEETAYIIVEKYSFDNINVNQNFSNEYDTSQYIYLK